MMTNARYAVTFLGNGIIRLPRAGIFQTGTRAVVDETVARIAVAHGSFGVEALGADPLGLASKAPAVAAPPPPMPAPPVAAAPERKTKGHRTSAAMRVPARSEESAPIAPTAPNPATR